jgi:hypothetical protein
MFRNKFHIYKDECLDADHMVYQNVLVSRRSLLMEIYGYPEALCPPTAFHTSTYVPAGNAILIIGNRSSSDADNASADRGITPVYFLEVGTWKMEKVETGGDGPGIIGHHQAELQIDIVTVTGAVRGSFDEEKIFQTERRVVKDGKADSVKVETGDT